jgi:hypothetical protein
MKQQRQPRAEIVKGRDGELFMFRALFRDPMMQADASQKAIRRSNDSSQHNNLFELFCEMFLKKQLEFHSQQRTVTESHRKAIHELNFRLNLKAAAPPGLTDLIESIH